jgi:N-acetyl-gamma-glutamyl-phosphate reductase
MHNTPMATTAIVGASGYVGQETLDRVLAHPALELYALGSDTLAGLPADALDPRLGRNGWSRIPRFITNAAALSCGADVTFVCLSHVEAARLVPPQNGDHPVALIRRASICGAQCLRIVVRFDHPRPQIRCVVVRLPEVSPPEGR